jgi:murein DD-endopeptidase MepM/ murein hydrolase activator NlpD
MMFAAALVVAQILAPVPVSADFKLHGPMMQGGLVTGLAPAGTLTLTLNGAPVKTGLDGAFVIGFGREALPRAELTATLADGKTISKSLAVAARAWRIQAINGVPPKTVNIPPELQPKRDAEIAQIVAARATMSDRRDWQRGFIWPAQGEISGVYGSHRTYNGQPGSAHMGVDVAAPKGAAVVAPAGGVVKLAAPDFLLEGGLIIIDHGFGIYSSFLHLSRLDVTPGQEIKQGERIGAVGGTGRATGPHLHWGLNWNSEKLDVHLLMPLRAGLKPAGLKPMMVPEPMVLPTATPARPILPAIKPEQ